jgi:hypothetical protein
MAIAVPQLAANLTWLARQWPPGYTIVVTSANTGTLTQVTVTVDDSGKTVTLAFAT